MISFNKWFFQNALKPLLFLLIFLFLFILFLFSGYFLKSKAVSESSIAQLSQSLSFAITQKNRPQIDSILSTVRRLDQVEKASLCFKKIELIGRDQAGLACQYERGFFIKDFIITGNEDLRLVVAFKNPVLSLVFVILFLVLGISLVGAAYILLNFKNKFYVDLYRVLLNHQDHRNEINILELAQIVAQLQESQRLKITLEKQKALNELSRQVSHDIRSPLATLNFLIDSQKNINLEDLVLIKKSIKRINDISNDLLNETRSTNQNAHSSIEVLAIDELLQEIISEKVIEYKQYELMSISLDIKSDARGARAQIDKKEFSRVVSNLINNAAEAMGFKGIVVIELANEAGEVVLKVKDQGGGIPHDLLEKLGKEEISTKQNGNGIGLTHAMRVIRSFNGTLELVNDSVGLNVIIKIPAIGQAVDAVLIDNDELCRIMWERKAKNKGIKIITCSSPEHFTNIRDKISSDTKIYLDSDLGNGLKGEEFASQLFSEGFPNLFMATGYSADHFSSYGFLKGVISKSPPF